MQVPIARAFPAWVQQYNIVAGSVSIATLLDLIALNKSKLFIVYFYSYYTAQLLNQRQSD